MRVSLFHENQNGRAADTNDENEESEPDDQIISEQAEAVTNHVSDVAFPRSHWTVVRAVRSMRMPTETFRPIWGFERT